MHCGHRSNGVLSSLFSKQRCLLCVLCLKTFSKLYANFLLDEGALLSTLANVECNMGIICGSLPEIRPLFMRLFKTRSGTSTGSHQQSNPKSDRSHKNPGSPQIRPYDPEALRREKSLDSLGKVSKWGIGIDSHHMVNETVYLENLSPEKMRSRQDQRTSGSEADGSHGSEENWVSGGEIHPHKKNIPASAL